MMAQQPVRRVVVGLDCGYVGGKGPEGRERERAEQK